MTQIATKAAIPGLPNQAPTVRGRYLSIGAAVWIALSVSVIFTNGLDADGRAMLAGDGMLTNPAVTVR